MNLRVRVLDLTIHDSHGTWGFNLLCVTHKFYDYSLLRFEFRLPNCAEVRRVSIDHWDVLFMAKRLWKHYDRLSDSYMWMGIEPRGWDKFKLRVLGKLFN